MQTNLLDNPIWNSLQSRHAEVAVVHGVARRYPASTAPFLGVPDASDQSAADARSLVNPGERVGMVNVIPPLDEGWSVDKRIMLHQYTWQAAMVEPEAVAVKLGEDDIPAMLELTALVYPAYFRAGTARLGDYYGVFEDGALCAMAGLRMSMDGFQELSAICTHPDFRGRGLAAALTRHLVHVVMERGDTPFLHTESDNTPAQALYEKLGFTLRAKIPFVVATRLEFSAMGRDGSS